MAPTVHFVGDLVQVNPMFASPKDKGVVWEVTAVPGGRRRNVSVQRLDSPDTVGDAAPSVFIGKDHPAWVGTKDDATLRATKVTAPDLTVGMVITVPRYTGLYVVTGVTNGKARAHRLGGSPDGKYLTGILAASATIIPLAELADHL